MQKDMVKADAVVDSQLEHRLAPLVAGQELASAVIQDTVKYLGIQPTGISQLNGPYLQVRPAGSDASDILLVGSWRTHYQPGGDGSGPVLDSMQRVVLRPSPTAQLQASESDGSQLHAGAHAPARVLITQAGSLTTPGAAAALATDGLYAAADQGRGRNHFTGHHDQHWGHQQLEHQQQGHGVWQQDGDGYTDGAYHGHQRHPAPAGVPVRRAGPIIEECPSDAEPSSPRRQAHHHHERPHHHHQPSQHEQQQGDGLGQAVPSHDAHAAPVVQFADSMSDPDRIMEDASALPQQQHLQEERMRQQRQRSPEQHQQGKAGDQQAQGLRAQRSAGTSAAGTPGHVVRLEGPGMAAASAFASAAAAAAAFNGGASIGGEGPSTALVPSSAGPLQYSPRPRSEWELDPSKIDLGRRLAVGGFGEVFLAKYEGTLVAVKRLLATDSDTTQRFIDEVHMLASLRHPNLLLFMGYTLNPEPSIVTEFMGRGSLFRILRQAGNRPPDARFQRAVAVSVARGMAYLHSRRPPILHLDLKSPNVLVDDRWRVKIADFGLSRVRQRTYVSSGATSGSPEWMAPEVLRCDHYAEAADVYSFGVVLWELLTGQAPWADLNAMQVVGAVGFARRSLPDPSEGNQLLLNLCKACRAHDPAQRPSFAQIVEAIDSHFGPPAFPTHPNATAAGGEAVESGKPDAGSEPPPQLLPPPEAAAAVVEQVAPGEAAAGNAGDDDRVGARDAAAASALAAPLSRLTRRHSLADVTGARAGGSATATGSLSNGGAPLRLETQFASVHESPRSRRRYRSPRGQDMVGPPAVTARMQDGRKTPSPRTVGGRPWRGGAFSDDEYEVAHEQRQQQLPGIGAEAQPIAVAAPAAGVWPSRIPASASPFAAMATSRFGPSSATDVRKLNLDALDSDAAGDGAGETSALKQAMEIGSPRDSALQAGGLVEQDPSPPQQSSPVRSQAQEKRRLEQVYTPSALQHVPLQPDNYPGQDGACTQVAPVQPQQQAQGRQQQQPEAFASEGQQPPGDAVLGSAATARQIPLREPTLQGRPGHRRVSSDEAGRLQRLHAALGRTTVDAAAGGALGVPPSQQRLLASAAAAAAAAGGGVLPPMVRRTSRGLARHSAPMRYTYGGAPVAAGIGGHPLQHPAQQHLMQVPSRPRAIHGHNYGYQPHMHQQQQLYAGSGGEAAGLLQQYEHQLQQQHQQQHLSQQQRGGAGGSVPSTPAAAAGSNASAAALAAPVSLSPLAGAADAAAMQRLLLASAAAADMSMSAGGGDPWPDTHSELSFAFILRDDNTSVCSDDYPALPLLEEDEMADRMMMEDQPTPFGSPGPIPSSFMERARRDGVNDMHGNDDTDFELPRPFEQHSPRQRPQFAPAAKPPASPFAALAAATPGEGGDDGGSGNAAPEADLWAALQQSPGSSGLRSRGYGAPHSPSRFGSRGGNGVSPQQQQQHHWSPNAWPHGGDFGGDLSHAVDVRMLQQPQQQAQHSQQQLSAPFPAEQQQQAAPKTASRGPSGNGMTTYHSGRFKVTIEPAGADAQQLPQPQQEQQQQQEEPAQPHQQQSAVGLKEEPHYAPAAVAPLPDGVGTNIVSVAAASAPLSRGSSREHDGAADPKLAPTVAAAGNGTSNTPLSPTASTAFALATSVSEAPAASSRPRSSLHGHGELGGGGPTVALNSVTMYRKGRFFVSAHAAAGTHSLSVTNPLAASAATSSLATGSGSGGGSPTESVHDDLDEHDGGASGPSSPLGGATAAAGQSLRNMRGSQTGSGSGSGPGSGSASPTAGRLASGAAGPAQPSGIATLGRQYSCGRFTVAESIVAAPALEPRRPSSGSAVWDSAGATDAAAAAAAAALPQPPVSQSAFEPATSTAVAASATAHTAAPAPWGLGPHCAEPSYTLPMSASAPLSRRSTSSPGSQQQQAGMGRILPPHGLQPMGIQTYASAGAAPGARASAPGGDGCGGAAPASPRAEQVVVRRVGRFTVREVDAAAGASAASSRNPSSGGAHPDAARTDLLEDACAAALIAAGAGAAAVGAAAPGAGATHGASAEDALALGSRHDSGSFASAAGCSRASSGSQGADAMDLGPQGQLHTQQLEPEQQPQQQQGALPPTATGVPATEPKIVSVRSRGRFKVIEHEAPPPAPAPAPLASEPPPPLLAEASRQQAQQGNGGTAAGRPPCGSQRPPLPAAQPCSSACPLTRPDAGGSASHGAGIPCHECAGQPFRDAAAAAAGRPPPGQLGPVSGGEYSHQLPYGGVLRPPRPYGTGTSAAAAYFGGPAAAAAAGAGGAPTQAPWGGSGPHAPEQEAQLHADMARMVRERMERNAQGWQQQHQQPQRDVQEHGLRRPALRPGDWPAESAGGAAGRAREHENEEEEGPGDRCTYELSFGAGLTIQISHELQGVRYRGGGDPDDGAEAEGEDAVMLDVGIVQEEAEEGDASDGEGRRGGRDEGDEAAEGEAEEGWEQQPLQPPETPAHEPAHERDRGWDEEAQRMLRRRGRWRRLGGYDSGEGGSNGEGCSPSEEDSMDT